MEKTEPKKQKYGKFMTAEEREEKEMKRTGKEYKKTGREKEYYKEYYEANKGKLDLQRECNRMKSLGVPDRIIDNFGLYTGAVVRMKQLLHKILTEYPDKLDILMEELCEPDDEILIDMEESLLNPKQETQFNAPYDN